MLIRSKIPYIILLVILFISCIPPIDREAMVTRHSIRHSSIDSLNSLTVGNGEFAFTADITGLQTFPSYYEKGIPLGTMAQWGWHSFPNPEGYRLEDVVKYYRVGPDSVPYYYQFSDDPKERKNAATTWLRENPHRLHLGIVGLNILKSDSTSISLTDIQNPLQELDLWTGELKSYFEIEGTPVEVITLCHPERDMLSIKITSPLLSRERLQIKLDFPYAAHPKFSPGYDFSQPDKHQSILSQSSPHEAVIKRKLDSTTYFTRLAWTGSAIIDASGRHQFILRSADGADQFECSISFSSGETKDRLPGFRETKKANRKAWEAFWMNGGAVDFSASSDPRAEELERRVILSQYLTRIQCAGSLPPQETGLTYNSWHGKFHLEMHWWHALHFILWNRENLIKDQIDYYFDIYDKARETAVFQGYDGVRWPKMTDPSGRESPSSVGVFLIWQQPHLIYYADLLYRQSGRDTALLKQYADLVFATAEFMASYARYDSIRDEYVLGPALIPAQERFPPETTMNPSFELAYWHWALRKAQEWRIQMGLPPDEHWEEVMEKLSPLPVQNSLYLFTETAGDSYTNPRFLTDHPMVLGLEGMLPKTDRVNDTIMQHTFDTIREVWNWETCWGWDFPLAAMNAACLGRPEEAVDMLLMETPKNRYLMNGHNYQEQRLSLYLPGNGGLLTAVAFLCTFQQSDGSNGFPNDGSWQVRWENLTPMHE